MKPYLLRYHKPVKYTEERCYVCSNPSREYKSCRTLNILSCWRQTTENHQSKKLVSRGWLLIVRTCRCVTRLPIFDCGDWSWIRNVPLKWWWWWLLWWCMMQLVSVCVAGLSAVVRCGVRSRWWWVANHSLCICFTDRSANVSWWDPTWYILWVISMHFSFLFSLIYHFIKHLSSL